MKALLAVMLLACVGLPSMAQTPRVYGRLTHRIETGKVRKLSKGLLTFSPLPGGPDITVKVGPNTRLVRDNKPAELKQIKKGNIVRVTFPIEDGTTTAERIVLLDKKEIPARR